MKKKVRPLLLFVQSQKLSTTNAPGLIDGCVWKWEDVHAFFDLVSIFIVPPVPTYNVFPAQITRPP